MEFQCKIANVLPKLQDVMFHTFTKLCAVVCLLIQLNLLEKERIRASQEQPRHHEMKAGDLHPTLHPLSKAKSEDYCKSCIWQLYVVCVTLQLVHSVPGIQSSLLRPLSASNVSSINVLIMK